MSLVLDGQLWKDLPTSYLGADLLDERGMRRILRAGGPFVRSFDLRGMTKLSDASLRLFVEACTNGDGFTGFTRLDLRGKTPLLLAALLSLTLNHTTRMQIDQHRNPFVSPRSITASYHGKFGRIAMRRGNEHRDSSSDCSSPRRT